MSREAMKRIKTWNERCEEHPDHQTGMISERMIQERMQEEIDELRQALETEQEPVAWIKKDRSAIEVSIMSAEYMTNEGFEPLYTAPCQTCQSLAMTVMNDQTYHEKVIPKREWVGLTDEQVEDEWERITGHSIFGGDRSEGRAMYISPDEVIEFCRAIEAKLKERNT